MKTNKKISTGMKFALITAIISGFSIFYNKLVIVKGIDPLVFNIIKNGGVAIILSLILLIRRPLANGKESPLTKKIPWSKLMLIGIVGGSIPFILFFQGLTQIEAINANLIQKSLFIWVALLAIPFLNEKIKPIQIIGYLLVIYANFFIGGLTGFSFSIYSGMILLATLFWSVENIIAKKVLKGLDSMLVAWGRMFFGTVILFFVAVFWGKVQLFSKISLNQVLPILGSISLLTIYVLSLFKALKLAPATTVTAILILATPITNILSAIFITHKLPLLFTLNTGIILSGVLLISMGLRWRKKIAV